MTFVHTVEIPESTERAIAALPVPDSCKAEVRAIVLLSMAVAVNMGSQASAKVAEGLAELARE
jgi:hypothetical protein